jgi:hypothetical protein
VFFTWVWCACLCKIRGTDVGLQLGEEVFADAGHDDVGAVDAVEAVDARVATLWGGYIFCTANTWRVNRSHTKKFSSPANMSLLELRNMSIDFWPLSYFIYSFKSK